MSFQSSAQISVWGTLGRGVGCGDSMRKSPPACACACAMVLLAPAVVAKAANWVQAQLQQKMRPAKPGTACARFETFCKVMQLLWQPLSNHRSTAAAAMGLGRLQVVAGLI